MGTLLFSTCLVTQVAAHPGPNIPPPIAPPAALSTSGDYATDVFSDPWDFSNDEDVPPQPLIGSENSLGISRSSDGLLTVRSLNNSTIKLVRTWGVELPWGRDGQLRPVDADRYRRISFRMYVGANLNMAVHYWTASGGQGLYPFFPDAGWNTYSFDLSDSSKNPAAFPGPWAGQVVRLELLRGGTRAGGNPEVPITLDWVRLHRADSPDQPPSNVPVPVVLSPNEEGGEDFASTSGNPWDFAGPDDVASMGDITNVAWTGSDMTGTTYANDSFVELPMRSDLNPDRYHRATVDVCYDGQMSFANAPGGGMNARFAWLAKGAPRWSETQDIIIYPGCNRMTVDLATEPAVAVNDENTVYKSGWRGQRFWHLRFDPNEDPGNRNIVLRDIRLADDAAFSTSYPITFADNAGVGSTADIYVTTTQGSFQGTRIARSVKVNGGVNTFQWNGTNEAGQAMPNATYWVYVVMSGPGGTVGTAMSTGPVRLERPVPSVPSYFVPLNPARLLDTRTGIGGNLAPLDEQVFTELDVTGVGGVPDGDVTAVVMNVTVDQPTASGYLSLWPSGEGQPVVSNLNFVQGQTVPNLVTVKVGANGRVNVFNSTGATSVVADVVGYYTTHQPQTGGRFTPLTPARLLDTRDGTGRGGVVGPVGQGQAIDLAVTGVGGVPASGVTAVALNVTVDQPTGSGFLTTWPTGEALPTASTHNFVPGLTVANLVLAKVGAGGKVSMFNSAGDTHLVADVIGYYSSSGGAFVPVAPQRLVDTREGLGAPAGPLGQQASMTVGLANGAPVPASASGVVVNVTSADSTAPSFLTAWPTGVERPFASTLNPRPAVPVPNQAYLKLGDGGALDIFNNTGATSVIVDVFGYFT
ncbi:MAG: hypothetical protein AB7L17_14380 [Ilumatobacteraceae bacterium]